MIHGLTVSTIRSQKLVWADLVDWNWLIVSKASILLIRLEILVSVVMDNSIEWRPPFE